MEQTATTSFEDIMHDERKKLTDNIQSLKEKRKAIDQDIASAEQELKAIDAYERAKFGKPATTTTGGKRRTGVRKEVLAIIQQHPQGITRQELLTLMNAEDKKAEQSISNAISNLKKAGDIDGEKGTYTPLAVSDEEPETEQDPE